MSNIPGLTNYEVIDDKDLIEQKNVLNIPADVFEVTLEGEKFEINLAHFNIDENNLEEEACTLGQYMVYYGDIFARARALLATAEQDRKNKYSEMYIQVKRDNKNPASALYKTVMDKMTESYIENYIIAQPEYQAVVNDEYIVRKVAFRAESWWKAIQKKADLINMLGYRQNAEYKKGY
jgi:hypothetical protein